MPGYCSASSISWMRPSQVRPSRHSLRGLSVTTVSAMARGAGSVAVSARPILPNTVSTSGNSLRRRSISWRIFAASATDIPGNALGM